MEGWVKLHRKISDNKLWTCEPFTRGQAWVDLILLASHQDTFFYVRGIKVDLKRGQLAWGEERLSDRWRWSRTKLRRFLKDMEKEQQIIQHKSNVIQVITIVNYNEYQQSGQQNGQQKNSRSTTEKHIQEGKEGKELKEIKKVNIPFDTFWDLYNKKVGSKESCLKKWNALKDDERQKVIDTLPKFIASIKDKQFQPYPETYLNNKRWNDEIVSASTNYPYKDYK